jgi:hypothetical protein
VTPRVRTAISHRIGSGRISHSFRGDKQVRRGDSPHEAERGRNAAAREDACSGDDQNEAGEKARLVGEVTEAVERVAVSCLNTEQVDVTEHHDDRQADTVEGRARNMALNPAS